MFLEMMGSDNIDLITTQTNLKRTKLAIEKNRPIPAITGREIRQWLGILMYMSVVSMPATHLHWNRSVRNEAVAGVMTRDRFREISSVIHLSDNDLQPERNTPGYDRLFKVRQFLTNINKQFRHLATLPRLSGWTATTTGPRTSPSSSAAASCLDASSAAWSGAPSAGCTCA